MDRLIRGFDGVADNMRKAVTFKDALNLHQMCGGYIYFMAELSKMMPPALYAEAEQSLLKAFLDGFIDPDLSHCLSTQVPPGDLKGVAAFRPATGLNRMQTIRDVKFG